MNCKNCGAKLSDNAKVCHNCGAFCSEETGYVLLPQNDVMDDFYSDDVNIKTKSRRSTTIIVIFIVLAILAAGVFYYLNYIRDNEEKPALNFTYGSGIINDDEKVIYVVVPDHSKIEFIHGVSLYSYDTADKNHSEEKAVTKDYQYTKSIDDSFRTIFFDTDDFKLKKDKKYTYTFEMSFSFFDSDKIYTYEQTVAFDGDITEEVSDIIFDHSLDTSMEETTAAQTTAKSEETTSKESTTDNQNTDFIYDGYWFTEPYHDADAYTIYSIKFNDNHTFTTTRFYKNGTADWQLSTVGGIYEIKDGSLITKAEGEDEQAVYKLDSKNASIKEIDGEETVQSLTNRKYNSIKNAEDFFGI